MGKLLSAACKEQWSHKTILFVELLCKEPEEGSLPSDQCVTEVSKGEGLFLCEDFVLILLKQQLTIPWRVGPLSFLIQTPATN